MARRLFGVSAMNVTIAFPHISYWLMFVFDVLNSFSVDKQATRIHTQSKKQANTHPSSTNMHVTRNYFIFEVGQTKVIKPHPSIYVYLKGISKRFTITIIPSANKITSATPILYTEPVSIFATKQEFIDCVSSNRNYRSLI